jgi:hypothetical protein
MYVDMMYIEGFPTIFLLQIQCKEATTQRQLEQEASCIFFCNHHILMHLVPFVHPLLMMDSQKSKYSKHKQHKESAMDDPGSDLTPPPVEDLSSSSASSDFSHSKL